MNQQEQLLSIDREHIWHPYTSMIDPLPVYLCKKAKGCYIYLESGEKLIEGMSSWWCAVHGYNNPRLNSAAKRQISQMSHVMFGGLTHKPAIHLTQKLIKMLPEGLNKVFYSDSGSVAVEVALKMAIQYQYALGNNNKNKIATISGGYHGDTWHAMSVCDPVGGMHTLYNGRLTPQLFAPIPQCGFHDEWVESDFFPMRQMLEENSDVIGAVIVEPIVQGAGGMRFYHPMYLKLLREECNKHDILLIADEIATGFYRSGERFACNHINITPDIMCLGKALTGGFMSFAATIATEKVAYTISKSAPHSFMHGPTFMGNPLAAAVALESLNILEEGETKAKIKEIESTMLRELKKAENLKNVKEVRVLGAIGVIELKESVNMAQIQEKFVKNGAWVRPFGCLVYIMPQYIISERTLSKLCRILVKTVAEA
ncbi:MAG: adenosylmethionine--8-amino-7-oxononanoate transaminase [Rikenellaceae bacterium]